MLSGCQSLTLILLLAVVGLPFAAVSTTSGNKLTINGLQIKQAKYKDETINERIILACSVTVKILKKKTIL